MLALKLFIIISALELCLWLGPFWRTRKIYSAVLIIIQSVAVGLLFGSNISVPTFFILLLSGYRIINLLRLIEGRTKADYLYKVSRKSSIYLILAQILIGLLVFVYRNYSFNPSLWLYLIVLIQLIVVVILTKSTFGNIKSMRLSNNLGDYTDRDLPSLTVALPARNETEALENCLISLVESDYPKLEILVLDDCSQNKHTPLIIKSFAQSGVRFIEGKVPNDNWLAKNYAYQQLVTEASGDLILFCGVDTIFEPESLKTIVKIMLDKKKNMLSFMPVNILPTSLKFYKLLLQTNRYAWELMLPRKLIKRPPVLSTCWIIQTEILNLYGGFKAVARSASPESYFAIKTFNNNGYSFINATKPIGITSLKVFSDQRATTIRTRYSQLHRRPELVGLLSISEFSILVLPLLMSVYYLISFNLGLLLTSFVCQIVISFTYSKIVSLTYQKFLWQSLFLLPIATIYDIWLLNFSMWLYEFKEVIWKDRNICLPIMHGPDFKDKIN